MFDFCQIHVFDPPANIHKQCGLRAKARSVGVFEKGVGRIPSPPGNANARGPKRAQPCAADVEPYCQRGDAEVALPMWGNTPNDTFNHGIARTDKSIVGEKASAQLRHPCSQDTLQTLERAERYLIHNVAWQQIINAHNAQNRSSKVVWGIYSNRISKRQMVCRISASDAM